MTGPGIDVVPANEAPWEDLQAVFGQRGLAHDCQCQWFKLRPAEWKSTTWEDRAASLRGQANSGTPGAQTTGLLAYLAGEPVGWCAVEPRTAYPRLLGMRVPWAGRDEDRDDAGVWTVSCFATRAGHRRRGVSRALARAAVDFARERGARSLEGYALETEPGREVAWGELYVGGRGVFEAAGFREVARPTPRRVVMRIDFARATPPAPPPPSPG
ncbi:MAG: GNAT family N-acetyltransferase [Arthrobacter sp.]|uniref:GNAT family N-acetyltransferase n=1 Tax=Arthrobacter sp. TaxID=1667 RepID=UPI00346E67A3